MKHVYLSRRRDELVAKKSTHLQIADIWDRLAAFVVDILFVTLSANILFSPIKRKIQYALLNENDGAVDFYTLLFAICCCALFLTYQTLSVYWFQSTLGKKIFNLKVNHIFGEKKITFFISFLRAFGLLVSVLFLGLPLLGIFSNTYRRPLHDRLSDCHVMSLHKTGFSPRPTEQMWVRIIYIVFISQIVIHQIKKIDLSKPGSVNLSEIITEPEFLCEEVSSALEFWPEKNEASRLDIALSMFGANLIDEDCLDLEAGRAIAYQEEMDKAYLAKAFVHNSQPEISEEYLKETCTQDKTGSACLVSQLIKLWIDKKYVQATQLILGQKDSDAEFLKVWAIKHYEKTNHYDKVLKLASELWPNPVLNDFIGAYKTIAYWNLGESEKGEELFQTVYVNLSRETQSSFLAETCHLEVENKCQAHQLSACQLLSDQMQKEFVNQTDERSFLAYIKSAECGVADIEDIIVRYKDFIDDPKIQMYLAGLKAIKSGKNLVAIELFQNILKTQGENSFLNYEVRSKLVQISSSPKEIESYAKDWIKEKNFDSYRHLLVKKISQKIGTSERGLASVLEDKESKK